MKTDHLVLDVFKVCRDPVVLRATDSAMVLVLFSVPHINFSGSAGGLCGPIETSGKSVRNKAVHGVGSSAVQRERANLRCGGSNGHVHVCTSMNIFRACGCVRCLDPVLDDPTISILSRL